MNSFPLGRIGLLLAAALAASSPSSDVFAQASAAHSPAGTTHPKRAAAVFYRHTVVDGLKIFYREAGNKAQPTLLLLHGFPASSFMFRDLIARLGDRFHLVAPDYPGFGYSDAPTTETFSYTFDHLAKVIEKFTRNIGLDRYGLYMQDFGGPVGFRIAVRNPQQISFLVIQNANAYEEGLPDSFWAPARALWQTPSRVNFEKVREAALSDAALEWNYTHGVNDPERINPDSWVLQRALLNRPGNKEIMLALLYDYRTNLAQYPQWQAYLREHQPPTLIVWGKNDVIFPPTGAYPYRKQLKNLDFNLLDTGHFALEEQSEVIATHIERFYSKLR
jgi:pimeloyl-ACP methyl ester carboxylesterase